MLNISNLSFSYDSKTLFHELTLSFAKGWTALIGANGSGKSTLLRLINGMLVPDSGSIYADGNIVTCPQIIQEPPCCFSDPEILNSNDFYALLDKLAIGSDWIERWETLSGGEKKRCLIADTLARKPSVLLLDEPANHIDQKTTEILLAGLSLFSGTGIVVSHNMSFLNALASSTVMLVAEADAASRVFAFALPPMNALSVFEEEQEGKRKLRSHLSADVRRIALTKKNAIREANEKKHKAMSKKNIARHDSDTRGKVDLARVTGKDKRGGQRVAALDSVLTQKKEALDNAEALGLRKTGAGLTGAKSERKVLCFLEQGEIILGPYTLYHPRLEIRNDSRIVISGANGSGKTSLLKHILGAINANGLKIWHLTQELSGYELEGALAKFQSLNDKDKGSALSVIYRLGSEPVSLFSPHGISPGEARKLCFALAMLTGASLIVLDEPTNHMDAVSAMSLGDAIQEYAGAVVIVTHDQVFAEKTGITFWELERKGNRGFMAIR